MDLKQLDKEVKKGQTELIGLNRLIAFYGAMLIPPHIKGQIEDLHARMEFRLKTLMLEYELQGIEIRKAIFEQVIKILKDYKGIK